MQPLQLTPEERVNLVGKLQEEYNSTDNSSTIITVDSCEFSAFVVEFDTEENTFVFSFKIGRMTERVPPNFLGCPKKLSELDSPHISSICEEFNTVLCEEFGLNVDVGLGSFTFYEQEDDAGWYIYEVEVE